MQETVSLTEPGSPCSHSNILLLYVALAAATALPEGLCRRWSALLNQALPAATAASCSYMSLSLQPQRSQRGCAGDGQPYCPELSLQPQQHLAPICRSHCSHSAARGAAQEMVSLTVMSSPCSRSNILLLYVTLTAATALPEGLCRSWSALLATWSVGVSSGWPIQGAKKIFLSHDVQEYLFG